MKLENSRRIELVSISFWKDRVGKCRGNLMSFHIVFEDWCCCFERFSISFFWAHISISFHIVSYRSYRFISFHIVSYRLISFHIVFLWLKTEGFGGNFQKLTEIVLRGIETSYFDILVFAIVFVHTSTNARTQCHTGRSQQPGNLVMNSTRSLSKARMIRWWSLCTYFMSFLVAIYLRSLVKTAVEILIVKNNTPRFYCFRSLYGCSVLIHLMCAGSSQRWSVKRIGESLLLHAILSTPGCKSQHKVHHEVDESPLEHRDSGTLRPI